MQGQSTVQARLSPLRSPRHPIRLGRN
jgi:hypothetical protein